MAGKSTQTKQLEIMHEAFSVSEYYNSIANYFYDVSRTDEKNAEIEKSKNEILKEIDTLLEKKTDERDFTNLEKLLNNFIDNSDYKKFQNSSNVYNENKAISMLKSLNSNVMKFAKTFKYTDSKAYASHLIENKDKENFNSLTAYSMIAKSRTNKIELNEEQIKRINELLGKNIDVKSISNQELYNNLEKAYNSVINLPYVQNTCKTNYLKASGFNKKNWIRMAIVSSAVGLFVGLGTLSGAPNFATSSATAIMRFLGLQLGPYFLGSGLITLGIANIRALILNSSANKFHDKYLRAEDKTKIFELVNKHLPKRGLSARKAANEFLKDLENTYGLEMKLGIGPVKASTYKSLVNAAKLDTTDLNHLSKIRRNNKKLEKRGNGKKSNIDRDRENNFNNVREFLNGNPLLALINGETKGLSFAKSKTAIRQKKTKEDENKKTNKDINKTESSNNKVPPIEQPIQQPEEQPNQTQNIEFMEQMMRRNIQSAKVEFIYNSEKYIVQINKCNCKLNQKEAKAVLNDVAKQIKLMAKNNSDQTIISNSKKNKGYTITITKGK